MLVCIFGRLQYPRLVLDRRSNGRGPLAHLLVIVSLQQLGLQLYCLVPLLLQRRLQPAPGTAAPGRSLLLDLAPTFVLLEVAHDILEVLQLLEVLLLALVPSALCPRTLLSCE